jgi:hypothetical protein
VQPTQSTGPYLLLQKGTAASSEKARPFTECSSHPGNRKRLHQVRRTIQSECLLSEELSSLLDDTEAGRACASPSSSHFSLSFYFIISYYYLSPVRWRALLRPSSDHDHQKAASSCRSHRLTTAFLKIRLDERLLFGSYASFSR